MICFVDYRITLEEEKNLSNLGYKIIKIPQNTSLYPAIDGHVDIQLCIIDKAEKKVLINKDISNNFKNLLKLNEIKYFESSTTLSSNYPNNISLNAFISENYLIHNLKYTDPVLINLLKHKKLINVKQGYTKCSILPINEKAIITNDPGISRILSEYKFDILLLPYGDIILQGFDYGFIGGVGGMISEDTIAFFGDLNNYIYGDKILSFLNKYGISPIYLKKGKLCDRGSLLVL